MTYEPKGSLNYRFCHPPPACLLVSPSWWDFLRGRTARALCRGSSREDGAGVWSLRAGQSLEHRNTAFHHSSSTRGMEQPLLCGRSFSLSRGPTSASLKMEVNNLTLQPGPTAKADRELGSSPTPGPQPPFLFQRHHPSLRKQQETVRVRGSHSKVPWILQLTKAFPPNFASRCSSPPLTKRLLFARD